MNFSRGTVKSSPYVGVFCSVTEEIALVPHSALRKEIEAVERILQVNAIRANIANSSLIGVLSKGIKRKIVVSSIIEKEEIKALEKEGLEILELAGYTSTGNLIAINEKAIVASPLVKEKEMRQLEEFFDLKSENMKIADHELVGASLTVTNKGFIAHPNISEKEFHRVEQLFEVKGKATTANYGDLFVGNSVIANTKGAIAGINTSGIELAKIDEGLRGE